MPRLSLYIRSDFLAGGRFATRMHFYFPMP